MCQQESKPRILPIQHVLKHNNAQRKTLRQPRSDMDNSEASRNQIGGGRSVLVLSQPLPHILKGVLGNIIYKTALNGQKTTTETAVISSVFSSSLKSLTRTRDHTHHRLSHRYSPVPTSFRTCELIYFPARSHTGRPSIRFDEAMSMETLRSNHFVQIFDEDPAIAIIFQSCGEVGGSNLGLIPIILRNSLWSLWSNTWTTPLNTRMFNTTPFFGNPGTHLTLHITQTAGTVLFKEIYPHKWQR